MMAWRMKMIFWSLIPTWKDGIVVFCNSHVIIIWYFDCHKLARNATTTLYFVHSNNYNILEQMLIEENRLFVKTGWSNAQYIFVIHFLLDTNECERGIDKLGTPPLLWSRLHCYHSGKWFMKGKNPLIFRENSFLIFFIWIGSFGFVEKSL